MILNKVYYSEITTFKKNPGQQCLGFSSIISKYMNKVTVHFLGLMVTIKNCLPLKKGIFNVLNLAQKWSNVLKLF